MRPHQAEPGTRWVYRTSDTFILTRALHNYLATQEGPEADIYQFVVDEIYRPLGLGPGAFTTMRTADDNWQGQAEGGYGQWWIPDDIAKIGTFLIDDGGKINGEQILHPGLLAAAMQQDPDDRGVRIDSQRMYNNSFWANRYTPADGYDVRILGAANAGRQRQRGGAVPQRHHLLLLQRQPGIHLGRRPAGGGYHPAPLSVISARKRVSSIA